MLRDVMYDVGVMDRVQQKRRAPISGTPRRGGLAIALSSNVAGYGFLFLCLFTLGVLLLKAKREAEGARGAHEHLQASIGTLQSFLDRREHSQQFGPREAQELYLKLSRASELERATADLEQENASLHLQLAAVRSPAESRGMVAAARSDSISAAKDDGSPNPPPAALKLEREATHRDAQAAVGDDPPRHWRRRYATRSAKLVAAGGGARTRTGCGNQQFLLLRGERAGSEISPWCP